MEIPKSGGNLKRAGVRDHVSEFVNDFLDFKHFMFHKGYKMAMKGVFDVGLVAAKRDDMSYKDLRIAERFPDEVGRIRDMFLRDGVDRLEVVIEEMGVGVVFYRPASQTLSPMYQEEFGYWINEPEDEGTLTITTMINRLKALEIRRRDNYNDRERIRNELVLHSKIDHALKRLHQLGNSIARSLGRYHDEVAQSGLHDPSVNPEEGMRYAKQQVRMLRICVGGFMDFMEQRILN